MYTKRNWSLDVCTIFDLGGKSYIGNRQQISRVEPRQFVEHDWMAQPDPRLAQAFSEPAQSVWEPSPTVPLEYPTSTVKRSVTRFHEQVRGEAVTRGDVQPMNDSRSSKLRLRTLAGSSLTPD